MEKILPGAGVLYSDQLLYGIYAVRICSTLLSGQSHYYGGRRSRDQRGAKIFYSLGTFAGASIAAAGLGGITLIPGIIAVSRTAAATEAGSELNGVYGDLWKQLGALMEDSLSFVKSGEQGDVNLYCGCAVLLFAGMYFFNKETELWKNRAGFADRFIFCRVSCNDVESSFSRAA